MYQYLTRARWRNLAAFLSTALLLLSGWFGISVAAPAELPEMGDPSAATLSPEEDYRLGQAFMRNLRQQVHIIEDPELNAYINSLGYRLLAGADTTQPFEFFIVDDPTINAFAGPGGHIGINSGLILTAKSEGELAAVMAHEIAHVTQHHLARAFQKASTVQLQTAAAILAAILIGAPQLSTAMITTAAAGNIQQQLNFTRSNEQEADRVGIDILANAGYEPDHMPGFFQRLQESYRYMDSNLPELLRTHPVTPNRIADSQNRARQYPHITEKTSPSFPYFQAKLRVMGTQDQEYRLKELETQISSSSPTPTAAQLYEYAQFQLKLGQLDAADRYSRKLLATSPEVEQFIALQAQIEIEQDKYDLALARLQKALLLFPNHPQLSTLFSEAQLQAGNPQKAVDIMRELIRQQQQFPLPTYYRQLAKAESAAGHDSNAFLALADYYYMIGQTRTAIEQVEKAQQLVPKENTFQQERMEARLAGLKEEALAEEKDKQQTNK